VKKQRIKEKYSGAFRNMNFIFPVGLITIVETGEVPLDPYLLE
jgi:hypothetical protein